MNKVKDELSEYYNRTHEQLSREIQTAEGKRKREIEKLIREIERSCRRNLRQRISRGQNIVGALEHRLMRACPRLRKKASEWAKSRGRKFEDYTVDSFRIYGSDKGLYPYKNAISKFGFQPYDVILFCRDAPPLLLECKASGVLVDRKGKVSLQGCKRRYVHYTDPQKITRIQELKSVSGTKLNFVFNQEARSQIYFVSSDLIYRNSEHLCRRNLELSEGGFLCVSSDPEDWPSNLTDRLREL